MVVARPAHFKLRAGIDFINTELCCKKSSAVEYAGEIMESGQPDKHRPSDRRLRPRSTCPRCKRLLAANVSCICYLRDGISRRATTRLPKVQDTGQTSPVEEPSSPAAVTLSENHEKVVDITEQLTGAAIQALTPQPSTSQSSSSQSRLSSEEPVVVIDTSALSMPSTSQVTSETPKRDSFSIVPRRLFTAKSDFVKGFTIVSTNAARKNVSKTSKLSNVAVKIPSKPHGVKVSVKSKGSLKVFTTASSSSSSSSSDVAIEEVTVVDASPQQVLVAGPSRVTPETRTERGSSQRVARHTCPECGKCFGSPGKLAQHMFVHTGERPFACTECTKAFSSKFKLVRHNLIHSAERRFNCMSCGRQFHRKDHLQNHSKIHDAIKMKFVCDRPGCGKEYGSANSARKHSAAHAAQDGNLECALCSRQFTSTPEVLHHLKIHAGSRAVKTPADRKFRCDHCERKFFTRKDVRRHLVVHTGLRDFLCQFCPQRFGRKDHLVRHIKKSHQGGRLKVRKRAVRRQPQRQVAEEVADVSETTGEVLFKVEDETMTFPSTSGIKQEMPSFRTGTESLKRETDPSIPLYPPPPYPKPDELTQFYSIDPAEIQKLFTSETDNGTLLMHLMDTVELAGTGQEEPGIVEMLPAATEQPELTAEDIETRNEDAVLGAAIDSMLREEIDNAPLPRFNQAFPQPPQ